MDTHIADYSQQHTSGLTPNVYISTTVFTTIIFKSGFKFIRVLNKPENTIPKIYSQLFFAFSLSFISLNISDKYLNLSECLWYFSHHVLHRHPEFLQVLPFGHLPSIRHFSIPIPMIIHPIAQPIINNIIRNSNNSSAPVIFLFSPFFMLYCIQIRE